MCVCVFVHVYVSTSAHLCVCKCTLCIPKALETLTQLVQFPSLLVMFLYIVSVTMSCIHSASTVCSLTGIL